MAHEQVETTNCPYCKEEIRADAVVCKHCRSRLGAARPEHGGICPYCREDINPEAIRCKHCGSDLQARAADDCDCGPRAELPYAYRARGRFGEQLAGECYNRCRLYCTGDPFWCHLVCSFICEHAPVTLPPDPIFR